MTQITFVFLAYLSAFLLTGLYTLVLLKKDKILRKQYNMYVKKN